MSGSPRVRVAVAAILAVALMGTACGARVAPYLGTGAAGGGGAAGAGSQNADVTAGGGSVGVAQPGVSTPGGLTTVPASGGPAGSSTGGVTATTALAAASGGAQLTPKNFPFDPSAQAALCSGTTDNTSSAPGVTATSITVGNVSGLTGVLANNFNQGPEAVQALFSAVNAAGGICGRQLRVQVEDDGQDATKNSADVADLIPKVLAFVGSVSDADNGGVPEMAQAGVPDLGPAIAANRSESPMYLSPAGSTQYLIDGHPYIYDSLTRGLKAFNDFPTRIATLAYQIDISAQAAQEFSNLFVASGSTNCFHDYSIQPTTPSLDQDVLTMQQNHCDGVYSTMDVTGTAKLLDAMQRQKFKPKFVSTTFDGYTPAQISVPHPGAAEGLQVVLPFVPFNQTNPVVQRYLSQLRTYEPGKEPSGFGFLAWAGGQMFIYALLKTGRNPTRSSLVSTLNAIENWDTGGSTGPITPRLRLPAGPCVIDAVATGNDFVQAWPKTGFFCDGKLVRVG